MSMENQLSSRPEQTKEDLHGTNHMQYVPIEVVKKFADRVRNIKDGKSEKPNEERVREIKALIDEVAEIFDNANVRYVLDGALNISLYGNQFFRDHRDIDVSVFSEDIPRLAEVLEQKGYALFRFPKDVDKINEEKKVLTHELLDPKKIDIQKISRDRLLFLRVNKNFEIDTENYEWFDIHAIDRNGNGDIIKLNGTIIPKGKYLKAPTYTTENGKNMQLSHPAILAYHKLFSGREHPDFDDLVILRRYLTESDLIEIKSWLDQDEEKGWNEDKPKIKKAKEWLDKLQRQA